LISLGSVNADFQMRVDGDIARQETLLAHDFLRMPGGKAANTAYLGALFGHPSVLLGQVGDDDLADAILPGLRAAGIDLQYLRRAPGQSTAVSTIIVPKDGKKHIVLATNANDAWDDAAIDAVATISARIALPACLVADCEVPARVVCGAIDAAAARGIPVVVDPSFPDRFDRAWMAKVTALTPNAAEAGALLGRDLDSVGQAAAAAGELCRQGARCVCIKLEDGGCVMAAAGDSAAGAASRTAHDLHVVHLPPQPVAVVDTTGAGDAFTGVFAIALLEGRTLLEAAAWGVAAANLAVTGYGSQPSYAGRERVAAMAAQVLETAKVVHA
jgi:ribokinase